MLSDILSPERVFLDLEAKPKDALLGELAGKLKDLGEVADAGMLAERLIRREQLVTTGVKTGFAFPHCFSPQVARLGLTIGRAPGGTDYESLDGRPVEIIFLLLGPEDHQDLHLKVLARLSRIASDRGTLGAMRGAANAEEVIALILEADRAQPVR